MKIVTGLLALGLGVAVVLSVGGAGDTRQPQTLGGEPQLVAQALPKSKTAKTIELTEKNDGQKISVKAGETVQIKLESNITTGYGWKVESINGASAVQNGKVDYFTTPLSPGSGPIVGRGGYNVVKFDATTAGSTTITLHYVRPWEKGKAPARTFEVTLDVK